MQRSLFIIACDYRDNPSLRALHVSQDLVDLVGFFRNVFAYDRLQIQRDDSREVVLEALKEELKFLHPGDLLLIYFGGHGLQTTEQLLVLPPGAKDPPGSALGFLSVAELRRQTDGRGLTRAMILDSCRNDDAQLDAVTSAAAKYSRSIATAGGSRDIAVEPALRRGPNAGDGPFSILSACRHSEVAPEFEESGKGLFSTALHNVLRASHKAGRRICLDDKLRKHVQAEMHRLADECGLKYKPIPYREGYGEPELFGPRRSIGLVAATALVLIFVALIPWMMSQFHRPTSVASRPEQPQVNQPVAPPPAEAPPGGSSHVNGPAMPSVAVAAPVVQQHKAEAAASPVAVTPVDGKPQLIEAKPLEVATTPPVSPSPANKPAAPAPVTIPPVIQPPADAPVAPAIAPPYVNSEPVMKPATVAPSVALPSVDQPVAQPPFVLPPDVAKLPAAAVLNIVYGKLPPDMPVGAEPTTLDTTIVAHRASAAAMAVLNDGEPLASGRDAYVVGARANQAGYLYIFQVDAKGKIDWLFPKNAQCPFSDGQNRVAPNQWCFVPANGHDGLTLDDTVGVEHLYFVFSPVRWQELDDALSRPPQELALRGVNEEPTVTKPLGLGLRGVSGKRRLDTPLDSKKFFPDLPPAPKIDGKMVTATGSLPRIERWFQHVP